MSDYNLLDVESRALDRNFVYYQRLYKTYPQLFHNIKSRMQDVAAEMRQIKTDGSKVRAMAQAEVSKELSALRSVFKINFSNDVIYDKNFYNELLNAINRCIGIKSVYERNVLLIQNSKGMKSIISFFPTYLRQQLQEEFRDGGRLSSKVIQRFTTNNNVSIEEAVREIMEQELPNIVHSALMRMLSSQNNVETKNIGQEYRNAYQQLYDELNRLGADNPLTQEIYDIYRIDELKELILQKVMRIETSNGNAKIRKNSNLYKKLFFDLHARGGYTLETIANMTTNIVLDGIQGGSVHTGNVRVDRGNHKSQDTGMKADCIITLNIDTTPVEEMIDSWNMEGGTVNREKSVQKIEELYNKVKDIDNGFIIYSSAKNYTYNDKFSGFKAGTDISLKTFENVMSNVSWQSNFNAVVGVILQIADGAIGQNVINKPELENLLARNVAYLLFDDVEQIGIENQSGANALHVLNLNGVYIPISLILFALADAIDNVSSAAVKDIVKINIKSQPILFKTAGEQRKWESENNKTPYEAWLYQRNVALDQTKIQAHFLKNFQDIIQQYITHFER